LVNRRSILFPAACVLLGACSATRIAYDNADTALRFISSSYLDLDAEQTEDLRVVIVKFHEWHRANELPAYATLMRSASERTARGITAGDVAWGLDSVRAHFRTFMAKASEDAAPVLVTLSPEQIAALERKFAENNEKFSKEYMPSDDEKRRLGQAKRTIDRFRDFAGELTPEQEERIRRFAVEHQRHVALRFEDRQQWQRDLIASLRAKPAAQDLARTLAQSFQHPEGRRSEAFIREDKAWDEDLSRLIVDLDHSLSPKQRAHAVRRLSDYANDFAILAGEKKEAA
jgi:Family of unknown function (DUF6279)